MAEKKTAAEKPAENTAPAIDIEALKAQIMAEIKAEESKKAAETTAGDAELNAWLNEYVEVQLFKDGKNYKDDVYVAVNGENCRIKRGVPVKIRRKFAISLEQQHRQDLRSNEFNEEMQREYENSRSMGLL